MTIRDAMIEVHADIFMAFDETLRAAGIRVQNRSISDIARQLNDRVDRAMFWHPIDMAQMRMEVAG